MRDVILAPPWGDTRGSLWTKSIGGTVVGTVMGLANLALLRFLLPTVFGEGLAWAAAGAIAGAVQGAFLRQYTRPPHLWLVGSAAGWLLAWVALIASRHTPADLQFDPLRALAFGAITGLFQWVRLRRHIERALAWPAICAGVMWLISGAGALLR